MGASIPTTSVTVSPTPTPSIINPEPSVGATSDKGDGNNDKKVDMIDLSVLLSDYYKNSGFRVGIDLNGDGAVNAFDFSLMRNLLIEKGVIRES